MIGLSRPYHKQRQAGCHRQDDDFWLNKKDRFRAAFSRFDDERTTFVVASRHFAIIACPYTYQQSPNLIRRNQRLQSGKYKRPFVGIFKPFLFFKQHIIEMMVLLSQDPALFVM